MAHGLRGRAVAVGAAAILCTGLVGCMGDKKPIAQPPLSRGATQAQAGTRTTTAGMTAGATGGAGAATGAGTQNYGMTPAGGVQQTGYNQPGGFGSSSSQSNGFGGNATPGFTGAIGGPTAPGNRGLSNTPMPTPSTYPGNPSVLPAATSNYPPVSNVPAATGYPAGIPTDPAGGFGSPRGQAPTAARAEFAPLAMVPTDPLPPPDARAPGATADVAPGIPTPISPAMTPPPSAPPYGANPVR